MNVAHLWSLERTEIAKRLFDEGKTAGEAGMALGISRNAVIGKWHRLGLRREPNKAARARAIKIGWELARAKRNEDKPPRVRAAPSRPKIQFTAEPLPPPSETDIARVSFMDLERHHCRFPVGDPKERTFGFCGCKPFPGLPYCEAHARRAYTPATLKAEPRPSFNVAIRKPARELVDA